MTLSNEWVMEQWWNYMLQGKRSTLRKKNHCPWVTFSTTNHTWGALGSRLGFCGFKPASNKLLIFANDRNDTHLPTDSSNIKKKAVQRRLWILLPLMQYSVLFFVETFQTFGEIYCLHLEGRNKGCHFTCVSGKFHPTYLCRHRGEVNL